ncbi:MAG: electron transport complex subunit RsxB [Gammaproteobacteria bacterium]|nr:MAG: electron transport complex subunit RsxB [Gammaproteobacteria bacterium]
MITAILAIGGVSLASGLLIGLASKFFPVEENAVVDQIEALLPQTQCGQCDFAGCHPYAEAIASGEAEINRCVPGGETTIQELADLLDREVIPLDEELGEEKPPMVALIIEEQCIGCTKCIQACPVDAIVGAAKQMHTVIADECTGCELCLPPCPVDCIEMVKIPETLETWQWPLPKGIQAA